MTRAEGKAETKKQKRGKQEGKQTVMTTEQNHSSEYLRQEALRRTRCAFVFAALAAAVLVMIVLNINTGSVRIPVARILRILFLRQGEENEVSIIWKIRMPRILILLAAELGGALALSGFLLQTFFGNPIAGPFVLGISSGAKMCVALVMIVFLGKYGAVSSWTLVLAAFAGAMLSTALILLVAWSPGKCSIWQRSWWRAS